jgi:DNA processing protein
MNNHFILHVSLIDGVGPSTINQIIGIMRSGASVSDLYSFSSDKWMSIGFTHVQANLLASGLSDMALLTKELSLIEQHHITWATILDDFYPQLLREIYLPPAILYWQGGNFDNERKHIAFVGSRAANEYGRSVIACLVPELVAAGAVIVSGGAVGIDTVAHTITCDVQGKTIVVLGSGLLQPYPHANKKLFTTIIENGGIVCSSFPLTMRPLPGNFPARNRIISGLSHGCVVVQAAQKSGALITANYALEQGREVFAVPGSIHDPLSQGCHELVHNGAKLVMNATDIMQECSLYKQSMRDIQSTLHEAQSLVNKQKNATEKPTDMRYNSFSDIQKKIIFACKIPRSFDEIVEITLLERGVVQSELFSMQLDRILTQDFLGMWCVEGTLL